MLCRIREARAGSLVLEFVRKDALATPVPALPVSERADLAVLPIGRCEDGTPWLIRLRGTHVLLAGSTGAGKASLIWGMIRALLPALLDGTARVWGADPKLMELALNHKKSDLAIKVMEDAVEHNADEPLAYYNLISVYDKCKMFEQAEQARQRLKERFAKRSKTSSAS